jgi:hypothetical protein
VVEVVHMKCVGIGTPQVNVELYRSGYLPLMTCPMFDKWVVGCAKQRYGKDYSLIRRSLYGEDGTGGMTDGIPLGMTTLLNLMRQQGKVLYGMAVDTTGDLLGSVLGFGATSVVFKGQNYGGPGYAIKVARSKGREARSGARLRFSESLAHITTYLLWSMMRKRRRMRLLSTLGV